MKKTSWLKLLKEKIDLLANLGQNQTSYSREAGEQIKKLDSLGQKLVVMWMG